MRNFIFFLSSMTIYLLACSSQAGGPTNNGQAAESPDIQIQVQGQPAGPVSLIGLFGDQQYKVDSTQVDAAGNLRFQREEPYPAGLYYVLFANNGSFALMVDQDQTMQLKTQSGNFNNSMEVEGNLDTKLLYENTRYEEALQVQILPINQQLSGLNENDPKYAGLKAQQDKLLKERDANLQEIFDKYPNSLFAKYKMAGQNPAIRDIRLPNGQRNVAAQAYHYRADFWNNVDFSDERLLRTPVIMNKLKRYVQQLTVQQQDSIIKATDYLVQKVLNYPEYYKFFTNFVALNYEPGKTTLMDGEAVMVHMVKNYFTKDRAFWADSMEVYAMQQRASEMEASLIGRKGPDVVSFDPNGKQRSIYEIKAPYVVVFMYNPTCEHCIEETPRLLQFYNEWKNRGVEVFGIAIDTEPAEWKNFIARNNLTWINVFDPTNRSIYGKYFVDNTPEIYVLNPQRTIIGKNLKPEQIAQIIERDRS